MLSERVSFNGLEELTEVDILKATFRLNCTCMYVCVYGKGPTGSLIRNAEASNLIECFRVIDKMNKNTL